MLERPIYPKLWRFWKPSQAISTWFSLRRKKMKNIFHILCTPLPFPQQSKYQLAYKQGISISSKKSQLKSQAGWPMPGRGKDQDSNSVQTPACPSLATQHWFSTGNNVCSPGTHTCSDSLTAKRQILANETKVEGCWRLWEDFCFFWSRRQSGRVSPPISLVFFIYARMLLSYLEWCSHL